MPGIPGVMPVCIAEILMTRAHIARIAMLANTRIPVVRISIVRGN